MQSHLCNQSLSLNVRDIVLKGDRGSVLLYGTESGMSEIVVKGDAGSVLLNGRVWNVRVIVVKSDTGSVLPNVRTESGMSEI